MTKDELTGIVRGIGPVLKAEFDRLRADLKDAHRAILVLEQRIAAQDEQIAALRSEVREP